MQSRGNVRCPCVEEGARWSSAMVISLLMPRRSDAGARHHLSDSHLGLHLRVSFGEFRSAAFPILPLWPLAAVPDTIFTLYMLYARSRVLLTTTYLFVQACTKSFPCTSAFVAARSQPSTTSEFVPGNSDLPRFIFGNSLSENVDRNQSRRRGSRRGSGAVFIGVGNHPCGVPQFFRTVFQTRCPHIVPGP